MSGEEHLGDLFAADREFYKVPERPQEKLLPYTIPSTGEVLNVHVVGHHVLWANYIWNGAHWLSDYIDQFQVKTVLELGADASLINRLKNLLG
jgi:predicted nicotinamide N-methyase